MSTDEIGCGERLIQCPSLCVVSTDVICCGERFIYIDAVSIIMCVVSTNVICC